MNIFFLILIFLILKLYGMTKRNYITKNILWHPSSFQGEINCSYDTLVKVFGKQNVNNDGYKTDAEWELLFDDGTHATIYNWKNGTNYLGEDGDIIEDINTWHIGGQSKQAVDCVKQAIDDYLKEVS